MRSLLPHLICAPLALSLAPAHSDPPLPASAAAPPRPALPCLSFRCRGWWTKTSGNMRPLECPTGFRYATRKDEPLLRAFVQKEFLTVGGGG